MIGRRNIGTACSPKTDSLTGLIFESNKRTTTTIHYCNYPEVAMILILKQVYCALLMAY